ncbi:GTPase Era [Oceanivirga miroungae]|uniref:GTPase Era n=1 Tax=Oceanivirga miroungae TaxID=1130046 RepID=A0A6I8M880_9FUSO|nr:GTPase Era [Oceanivirga miroungae]VWL85650.1 GTP-binding protein Era [Oceanivirga miroungae]
MKSGYVSLIGRPNVGKSTLLNRLIKEKLAIVSDKSGTTREQIKGITNIADTQYIFFDTPGIHKPKNLMGEYMTTVSLNTLEESDVILFILDGEEVISTGDLFIYENILKVNTPFVIVINKIDKMTDEDISEKIKEIDEKLKGYSEIITLSSEYLIGVHKIYDVTKKYFTNDIWFYPEDYYTDMSVNRIVIEVIREKILLNTRDEIPHSVVVEITNVKTLPNIRHYDVTIYVERTSQKGIIIGENGKLIKKIGIESRKEIENLISKKVNLRLWVKIKKNWRKDKKFIEEMGYKI